MKKLKIELTREEIGLLLEAIGHENKLDIQSVEDEYGRKDCW